jgi:hypothetical protein
VVDKELAYRRAEGVRDARFVFAAPPLLLGLFSNHINAAHALTRDRGRKLARHGESQRASDNRFIRGLAAGVVASKRQLARRGRWRGATVTAGTIMHGSPTPTTHQKVSGGSDGVERRE